MEEYRDDDILREVRAIREAFAAQFNGDIGAMFRYLREQEEASGRVYVQPPPRPQQPAVQDELLPPAESRPAA